MKALTAKQISEMLAQRAENIASHLLPNGKRVGSEWRVGSLDGEVGDSLGVRLSGDKAGVWSDFQTGDAGDLLDLWSYVRKINLSNAMMEAKKYLGINFPVTNTPGEKRKWNRPKLNLEPVNKNKDVLNYLTEVRKISNETLSKFKISAINDEIIFPFYREDELIFAKYLKIHRVDGKKQMHVASNCEPVLFGWQAINPSSRSVTICEGEIDAMTLSQYGFEALSIPLGAGSGSKHDWLENEFDNLSVFDEIFLCMDNDDAGKQTVLQLLPRLGQYRCRVVRLPFKDANECLQNDITSEEIKRCYEVAVGIDPQELKQASSFLPGVIEQFYPTFTETLGISVPWKRADDKVRFRPGELSLWTGTNGHGKSQMIGQIILHSIANGVKVCVASLELKPEKLLTRLTIQAGALRDPTVEYITAIHEWYHNKLWLFDLVGTAKHDRLLEVFLYARQRYNINVFVIDSLMKCGIIEDDYKMQKLFIDKLCDFKNQYNCHIHLIAHPRKARDEEGMPGKLDIKGTGAVSDLADNCFSVWRNKKKEEEIQKKINMKEIPSDELLKKIDCLWTCDKQRNGDWEGKMGLWFDKNSYQYLDQYGARPKHYVQFSKQVNHETKFPN